MKRHLPAVLILAAAVLAAVPVANAKKESLRLYETGVVNGVVLEAGDYKVELAPSLESVSFLKGRRVVVSAPAKVRQAEGALLGDAIHYRPGTDGRQEIVRVVLAGSRLSIEIVPEKSNLQPLPIAKAEERR